MFMNIQVYEHLMTILFVFYVYQVKYDRYSPLLDRWICKICNEVFRSLSLSLKE